MSDYIKMRKCSYLLPDPGGEVVRELLDDIKAQQVEIGRLRDQVRRLREELAPRRTISGNCVCKICGRWGDSDGGEPDHMPSCPLSTVPLYPAERREEKP